MQDLDITLSDGVKLSKIDFDEFEREIGAILPEDFKEFYLKHNGGMPSISYFDMEHEVCEFFHLNIPYKGSIVDMKDTIIRTNKYAPIFLKLPEWGLPFACDSFGNLFILNNRNGDGFGNVWFFDHEGGEKPSILAKSFRDFINSLKSEEEVEDE